MLIDMELTIAYKCFSCGTFDFSKVNLFELFMYQNKKSCCKCGNAILRIEKVDRNYFRLLVPCIGCGAEHQHLIHRESLLCNKVVIYTCPITGIKNCFIGKDDAVRKLIDGFEKELNGIIDGFGYDSYFENPQVMLDTLNKIHDIAENGNLSCECGCNQIMVSMLERGIVLKCIKCYRKGYIPASTNNDLKKILQRETITLLSGRSKMSYHKKN